MTSSTTKLIRLTTVTTRLIRRRPWNAHHWEGGSHNIDVQSAFHDPWLWCFEHISHLCLLDGELTKAAEEDGDDPGEHVPRTRPHVGTQLRWLGWWGWWCLKTLISLFTYLMCVVWKKGCFCLCGLPEIWGEPSWSRFLLWTGRLPQHWCENTIITMLKTFF